jgi:hypothetical protein
MIVVLADVGDEANFWIASEARLAVNLGISEKECAPYLYTTNMIDTSARTMLATSRVGLQVESAVW